MESFTFVDLSKICRVCLKSEATVSVFSDAFTVRPVEMVQKIDLFKVDNMNGLPTWLCQTCTCRLIDAYNLKEQCEYSTARLHEYLYFSTGYTYGNNGRDDLTENYMKTDDDSQVQSHYNREDEMYDAVNFACEILNDASRTHLSTTDDDVLNDVIVDVSSLPQPEGIHNSERDSNCTENSQSCELGSNNCKKQSVVHSVEISQNKVDEAQINEESSKVSKKSSECCPECGKKFSFRAYLETHLRVHTGEKPFRCEICKRTFSQMSNLTLHRRIHTGEKRYQCEICAMLFTTSSNLNSHKIKHSDARSFQCSECLRYFKTPKDLNNHTATHSDIKLYTCKVCHREFLKMSYLNVHVRKVHHGERKHKCTECNKAFSSSSNLVCHLRTHTGEKPYKCDVCHVNFNQSSALVRHTKKHSKKSSKMKINSSPDISLAQAQKDDIDKMLLPESQLNDNIISPLIPTLLQTTHDMAIQTADNNLNNVQKDIAVNEYIVDFSKDTSLDFPRHQYNFEYHQPN